MRSFQLLCLAFFLCGSVANGQSDSQDATLEYRKVVTERSAKIVNTLSLKDSSLYKKTVSTLAERYIYINHIHDSAKLQINAVRSGGLSKEEQQKQIEAIEINRQSALKTSHDRFLSTLSTKLSPQQVTEIKDGMTYRILPVTYAAYQDMLPDLTEEQKKQVYAWLVEARELAMDAESSEKKHQIFGKYKGRINNYFSAAGIDMKKAGEEWQKRVKAREAGNQGK